MAGVTPTRMRSCNGCASQQVTVIDSVSITTERALNVVTDGLLSFPHPHPCLPWSLTEISTKATIVNFAVKEQGLEAQLLSTVVKWERPDLDRQKNDLVVKVGTKGGAGGWRWCSWLKSQGRAVG